MPELRSAYPLRTILNKAWCLARAGAKRFGGTARAYFNTSLKQAWEASRSPAAAAAAMRARVRHSIATLAADHAACDAFMRDWYARQEPARVAEVLPFPARRPTRVVPAPTRRAA